MTEYPNMPELEGDSVDVAKDDILDVKPRKAPYAIPVDRIRGIVARLKRPDTKAPWIVKHTHQVYRLGAFDLGDHVAEFESDGDAEHAVACVNAILEIENILKEVENA